MTATSRARGVRLRQPSDRTGASVDDPGKAVVPDPSPLEFLDYRAYLRAWFAHRNLRPSMRKFAQDVGCSSQLVSFICTGKRTLGDERAEQWANRIGLLDLERSYFLALVRSEEAPTSAQRQEAFGSVQAMRSFRASQSNLELLVGLFSRWLRPIVHEMARLPEFVPEAEWVRARLGPQVALDEAKDALDWLSETGLLGPDGQQAINAALASTQETSPGALTEALAQHHFDLLEIAREQLHHVAPMHRNYINITAAITADQQRRLREELQEFQRRLYAIANEEPEEQQHDRVFALSIQLFPLTIIPDDEPSD